MTRRVNILRSLAISLEIEAKIVEFETLFARWNESINLSAARTKLEIAEHVDDSLAVISHVTTDARVLDVGAGGGFPSVLVAICRPDATVVALEPVHKKHAFLRTAARELGLVNFEPLVSRVEDHPARDYDIAMSRATFDLRDWLDTGLTLIRPGGRVIGFEGVQRTDLPASVKRYQYELEGKQRALVIVERT